MRIDFNNVTLAAVFEDGVTFDSVDTTKDLTFYLKNKQTLLEKKLETGSYSNSISFECE